MKRSSKDNISLDRIAAEVLPVEVSGSILYGLNRTKDGWLVYLINNNGINKYTDTPAVFDLKQTSKVTVRLKAIPGKAVRELRSGVDVPLRDGKFSAEVKPGEVKIYRIKCK